MLPNQAASTSLSSFWARPSVASAFCHSGVHETNTLFGFEFGQPQVIEKLAARDKRTSSAMDLASARKTSKIGDHRASEVLDEGDHIPFRDSKHYPQFVASHTIMTEYQTCEANALAVGPLEWKLSDRSVGHQPSTQMT